MKLFIYRPKGHGNYTFSVIAENEKNAFEIITKHLKSKYYDEKRQKYEYEASGWDEDYYELETKEIGEVFEHSNE